MRNRFANSKNGGGILSNTQGFTLIELLAVIVIIGLLAVLIIPKVSQTIKNARSNINNASVSGLIRVADNYYLEQKTMNRGFQGCSYNFTNNINTCEGIEFSGEKPENGILNIDKDGDISIEVKIGNTCYIKGYNTDKIISQDYDEDTCKVVFNGKYISPSSTDTHKGVVYLDPTNLLSKCDESNYDSAPGTKIGCMKFYIFRENSDGTIDMILDHNSTYNKEWSWRTTIDNVIIDGSNVIYRGPKEALYQLYEDTKDWDGIPSLTSNSNYTIAWQYDGGNYSYTIDYTKHLVRTGEPSYTYTYSNGAHKARFITAEEVAVISGMNTQSNPNNWNLGGSEFYFGSLSSVGYLEQTQQQQIRQRNYSWLFDNLNNCEQYGCEKQSDFVSNNSGYWTASIYTNSSSNPWHVSLGGSLYAGSISGANSGIRPVITVQKSMFIPE